MNKEELKQYDGGDGRPVYFAYKGKVYDVTESKLWKTGKHMNRHQAGKDLSDFINAAPHDEKVMSKFNVIDEYEDSPPEPAVDKKEILRDWYRKYHPHPVILHYPIGLFAFSACMQMLFLFFKIKSFEQAALYSLLGAILTSFPVVASGLFSWWLNYQLTPTKIFKRKLIFSIILLITGVVVVVIRFCMPNISYQADILSFFYNALVFLSVPLILVIAYYGGKITWPS